MRRNWWSFQGFIDEREEELRRRFLDTCNLDADDRSPVRRLERDRPVIVRPRPDYVRGAVRINRDELTQFSQRHSISPRQFVTRRPRHVTSPTA